MTAEPEMTMSIQILKSQNNRVEDNEMRRIRNSGDRRHRNSGIFEARSFENAKAIKRGRENMGILPA